MTSPNFRTTLSVFVVTATMVLLFQNCGQGFDVAKDGAGGSVTLRSASPLGPMPTATATPLVVSPTATPFTPQPVSLRAFAANRNLYFGATGIFSHISDAAEPLYASILKNQFNFVTPEYEMMMSTLEPTQGNFNFSQADAIVVFAGQNGMKVRGHPLVWNQFNPAWVSNGNFTPAQLAMILQTYIQTVVSHYHTRYPGQVIQWVVVNEALNDPPSTGLKSSVWAAIPNYVNLAFEWAHDADPTAQLYYNDYGNEVTGSGTKGSAVLAYVQSLKAAGVPIDGVGLESHVGLPGTSPATQTQIAATMQLYATAGFKVAITEFDMSLNPVSSPSAAQLAQQSTAYHDYLAACVQASNCTGFSTWGITDKYSWIPSFAPSYGSALIFDSSYTAKPTIFPVLQSVLTTGM